MMKYTAALNRKTLKMNAGDLLKKVDYNGNGTYSQDELKKGIQDSASIFVKPLISDKVINKIDQLLDTNKDGKITEDELSKLLKQRYNLNIEDAKKMNVRELVEYLQKHEPKKKK